MIKIEQIVGVAKICSPKKIGKLEEKNMFEGKQELVLIEHNHGISNKNQKPYSMFKFANPLTFENFTLSASNPLKDFTQFATGEKVLVNISIRDQFNRATPYVDEVFPAITK